MRKLFFVFSLLILLLGTSYSFGKDAFVFRKVNWGMTKAQILKSEKTKPMKNSADLIVYKDKVLGIDSYVMYSVENNSLDGCGYIFNVKHTTPNLYIDDFYTVYNSMQAKYGEGKLDYKWKDTTFQNYPDNYGIAILSGALELRASWETDASHISLILSGDNYNANLTSHYFDKNSNNSNKDSDADKL